MVDLIVIGIIVLILGCAIFYIVKEKKKGTRCIGCPSGGQCASKKCSCHTDVNK